MTDDLNNEGNPTPEPDPKPLAELDIISTAETATKKSPSVSVPMMNNVLEQQIEAEND